MNIKEEDIITKEYLSRELDNVIEEKKLVTKEYLDKRFEEFRKDMSLEFHNLSNLILSEMGKYIGVVMGQMEDKFKVVAEAFTGIPELTQSLRDKSVNNDYEHTEFRVRLGLLEGDKKKK